ncbi:MAG: hypothetical protein OXE87_01395 [Chloroflexi bacterium]|nr:hypothetical protein [Chloroflexota bacterium]
MPADRPIALTYTTPPTRNDHGEDVPGTPTLYNVWGTRRDGDSTYTFEVGGTRGSVVRRYRIRWFLEIANVAPSTLTFTDGTLDNAGDEITFTVTNKAEVTAQRRGQDLRRRWLDIEAIWSA